MVKIIIFLVKDVECSDVVSFTSSLQNSFSRLLGRSLVSIPGGSKFSPYRISFGIVLCTELVVRIPP